MYGAFKTASSGMVCSVHGTHPLTQRAGDQIIEDIEDVHINSYSGDQRTEDREDGQVRLELHLHLSGLQQQPVCACIHVPQVRSHM